MPASSSRSDARYTRCHGGNGSRTGREAVGRREEEGDGSVREAGEGTTLRPFAPLQLPGLTGCLSVCLNLVSVDRASYHLSVCVFFPCKYDEADSCTSKGRELHVIMLIWDVAHDVVTSICFAVRADRNSKFVEVCLFH